MAIDEGLSFSENALLNRSLFLSQFNDVNIYVEDVDKEYEYEEIFERLFECELSLFSIFPLGGKEAVLKCFSEKGEKDENNRINIYIVDGDFNNIWENEKISSPNVFYLDRYNIEGYYYSREAVVKYMRKYWRCVRKEAELRLNLDTWEAILTNELGELFLLFAVVHRYCKDMKNVQLGTGKFLEKDGHVKQEEYCKYHNEICEKLENAEELVREVRQAIPIRFNGNGKIESIVCGKYQLESLCRYITSLCKKNIDRRELRSFLISNFDIAQLKVLKDGIEALALSARTA